MKERQMVFNSASGMTPDMAARLAATAERFASSVTLEHNGVRLGLDSLIGILSFGLRPGEVFSVRAEGADEAEALSAIAGILEA